MQVFPWPNSHFAIVEMEDIVDAFIAAKALNGTWISHKRSILLKVRFSVTPLL